MVTLSSSASKSERTPEHGSDVRHTYEAHDALRERERVTAQSHIVPSLTTRTQMAVQPVAP